MSKLIDLLERAGQQLPAPMGFAAGRQKTAPPILLIGRVIPESLAKSPTLADADVDAFLVADGPALEALANVLEDRVWGVRASAFTAAYAQELAGKGCDYVVFESFETEASVLTQQQELGTIVTFTDEHDDETVRALADLPTDAALFGPGIREQPLTVKTAMALQKVLGALDKPMMAEAPDGIAQPDIELLRDIGVAGLIVDVDTKGDLDKVSGIRRDIESLPKPRGPRGSRDALVPQASPFGASEPAIDDDEDY